MSCRIFADIVCPDGIKPQCTLAIDEIGTIESIQPGRSGGIDHDFNGCIVVPGFIDVHVHGGAGADFMDGAEDSVRTIVHAHHKYGTTSLLATTLTAEREKVDKALIAIRRVMDKPNASQARIVGVHLEGPYICAAKRGAQPLAPIRKPDVKELAHWIDVSGGAIKLITMAPDSADDGGKEFIEFATSQGIVVSVGHTNATYEQTKRAIEFGATHATHLFNAMPPLHHREPGGIGALMESDKVLVELIADGFHVHPAVLKFVTRAVGSDRVILITDAISGAMVPDGIYSLGGQDVIVKEGRAKFVDGTLAGSVITMSNAFGNIQRFADIGILDASRMAASNAARQIGIDSFTGSIEVGKKADLVVWNPDSQEVVQTISYCEVGLSDYRVP